MTVDRLILRSALGFAMLAPSVAQAQSPYSPNYVALAYAPSGGNSSVVCGQSNISIGPGVANANCASAGATFITQGRSVGGKVGAFASVAGSGLLNAGYGGSWGNTALGYWADRVNFTGAVRPATIDLTMSWDGFVQSRVSTSGLSIASAYASADWGFQAMSGTLLALYTNSASATSLALGGPASAQASVNDVQSFSLDVGSADFVDFIFGVQVATSLYSDPTASSIAVNGDATADFNNTGKITSFILRDQNGVDVTNQIQYDFENDTQIFPSVVATPEPASVTLLATGLLSILGMTRRRQYVRSE